jgi:hypothetical protein
VAQIFEEHVAMRHVSILRLPETQTDPWTRKAWQLYCDEEVEKRVRAKAAQLASRSKRLRDSGFNVPLLEVDEFISHVWILALKDRPDFPDRTGMILYFWRRMENLFKDKCRRSAGAHVRSASIDAETEEPATQAQIGILSMEKYRNANRESENADALRGFHAYLSLEEPELLPLLNLIIKEQIDGPREQAAKLNLQVKDIYRLRARLQLQAARFGAGLKTKQ